MTSSNPGSPWVSSPLAQKILAYLQVIYPILLLFLYILAFTIRSVATARNDNHSPPQPEQLGPGGKPLPKKNKKDAAISHALDFSRPRKLLFEWLSVGLLTSLAGNIAVIVLHAVLEREQQWWCGQAPTVCSGVGA